MADKIEHRIGVQAPAQTIWDLVSDIEGWGRWNPLYPKASGVLRIGARLSLTVALSGRPSREIEPVVLDWVPLEQIHWRTSSLGGLVRTIRYIEIEALSEAGCLVSNGELFDGLLGPRVMRRLKGPLRQGFTAMGEAIKAHAEAAWRAGAGAPTSSA
jgi:hypothetical protein